MRTDDLLDSYLDLDSKIKKLSIQVTHQYRSFRYLSICHLWFTFVSVLGLFYLELDSLYLKIIASVCLLALVPLTFSSKEFHYGVLAGTLDKFQEIVSANISVLQTGRVINAWELEQMHDDCVQIARKVKVKSIYL